MSSKARSYTDNFKDETVKKYQESGLHINEFCKRVNLPKSTVYSWIQDRKQEQNKPQETSISKIIKLKNKINQMKAENDELRKTVLFLARKCTILEMGSSDI